MTRAVIDVNLATGTVTYGEVGGGVKAYSRYRLSIDTFGRLSANWTYASDDNRHCTFANLSGLKLIDENGNEVQSMTGATHSASSTLSGSSVENIFDSSITNVWQSDSSAVEVGWWILVELPSAVRLSKYSLLFRNDSFAQNDVPTAFSFEGSNDGIAWDALDVQHDMSTGWTRGVFRELPLS